MGHHAENFAAWKAVMEQIQARVKSRLFQPAENVGGRKHVTGPDIASCCRHMSSLAGRYPGRTKVYKHLRTVVHFQKWCLGRPVEEVLLRFPEVKPLLAEREILR